MARLYTLFSPIYLTLLLVLVAAVAVNAAGVSDLPSCAGPCADAAAASSGCSSSDNACLCKSDSFRTATLNCSRQVCPKEDQSTTAGMLEEMCSTPDPSPSTSSSSTPGSTSSASSSSTPVKPNPTSTTQSQAQGTSATTRTTPSSAPTTTGPASPNTTIKAAVPGVSTGTGTATLSMPPSSTEVVLSTVTADVAPLSNAAHGQKSGEGMGIVGAMVVGLIALL